VPYENVFVVNLYVAVDDVVTAANNNEIILNLFTVVA
jgi:hypothetical protein